MNDDDYIELTDLKEIIRKGDGIAFKDSPWSPVRPGLIGTQVGEHPSGFRFRRPRAPIIRDAAIELLRYFYEDTPREEFWPPAENLREALGLTVEELGGEG